MKTRLAVLALVLAPATAFAAPFAAHVDFAYATATCDLTVAGAGGAQDCRAEIEGALDAECVEGRDGCTVRLVGTSRGVAGTGELSEGAAVRGFALRHVWIDPEDDWPRHELLDLCRAEAVGDEVACAFDTTLTSAAEDLGDGYGWCSFVGVDVASQTRAGAEGVLLPLNTHSSRSATFSNDGRSVAPGWAFCVDQGAFTTYEFVWYHS